MLGIGKLRDHACEHRAGDMTRTVTIMIVETYAATILIAGLPAHIDDPHPGVVQMGGEPRCACERRAINRGHERHLQGASPHTGGVEVQPQGSISAPGTTRTY